MRRIRHGIGVLLAALAAAVAAPVLAEENPALVETLAIMRERGLIDEAKHAELIAKNQQWEAAHPALLSRLEWTADFRGRMENFWYEEDPFDADNPDSNRGRYRLRIGARAKVNEVVGAGFLLASGDFDDTGCENRSTNRNFGTGPDFDMDTICIDQAYVDLNMPKRFLPEGTTIKGIVGKQANPFLWEIGKDILIWDNDITPEGVGIQLTALATEQLSLFGNAGYFISDENSSEKDPHVMGAQAGLGFAPVETIDTGLRLSVYRWGSNTSAFRDSANSFGAVSLVDISGDPIPIDYTVGEVSGYVRLRYFEDWPILLYGQFAQNFDAESIPGASGDQDIGWGTGIEIGDKKKLVLIGGGYYEEEANFAPAQFTDNDLFDGFTNRRGWLVWLGRELWPNTEVIVTFYKGNPIEDGTLFAIPGAPSSERMRLQTDFLVTF